MNSRSTPNLPTHSLSFDSLLWQLRPILIVNVHRLPLFSLLFASYMHACLEAQQANKPPTTIAKYSSGHSCKQNTSSSSYRYQVQLCVIMTGHRLSLKQAGNSMLSHPYQNYHSFHPVIQDFQRTLAKNKLSHKLRISSTPPHFMTWLCYLSKTLLSCKATISICFHSQQIALYQSSTTIIIKAVLESRIQVSALSFNW